MAETAAYRGTGKRKTSVARVILEPGSGKITVNGRAFEEYFPRGYLRAVVSSPLIATEQAVRSFFDGIIVLAGGITTGTCYRYTLTGAGFSVTIIDSDAEIVAIPGPARFGIRNLEDHMLDRLRVCLQLLQLGEQVQDGGICLRDGVGRHADAAVD